MTAKSFEEALEESLKEKLLYEKECICDQGEDGYFSCPYHDKYYDGRCMANWAREFMLKELESKRFDAVNSIRLAEAKSNHFNEVATLTAQLKEARRVIDAHHKWQMEYGGEGYYDGCFESHLCQTTREFLAKLEKGEG